MVVFTVVIDRSLDSLVVLVDKTRIKQIWLFGALISILIVILDDIGVELNLWNYPYQ